MTHLEENLELIKRGRPGLLKALDIPPSPELELSETRSGAVTGKWGACYLHSRFDPVKEAGNLILREVEKDISGAIFFGFGLGYLVEAFISSFPDIPALVFEPDPALFLKALESRPMGRILGTPHVVIHLGKDLSILPAAVEQLPKASLKVIRLRSVHRKDEAFYDDLDKGIQNFLARKEINFNTLNRFGKLWVKNLVKNMDRLITMPGIISLKELFKGIPAIILAGGPSAGELFPMLPELKERFLIIAVDTSLKMCLAAGVEPDFIVVVDPQYWNTRHIDWTGPGKALLISESSTHPRIFGTLGIKGFFASSFFPLGQYFETIVGHKGKIGAGGSVATSAWDVARMAGCEPIYMAGLDLGYPGKQTHFKGAFFEKMFHTISDRLTTGETYSYKYIRQAAPFYAEANDGGRVLTDKRMSIYKSWFDSQMLLHPSATTYNLSGGGLKIEGMPTAAPGDLRNHPVIRDTIDEKLKYTGGFFTAEDEEKKREQLKKALKLLLDDLENLEQQSKRGLREVAKIRKLISRERDISRQLANLDTVDQAILGQTSRIIAGFLLQPVIYKIVNTNTSGKSREEILESNEEIYRELRDSSAYHHKLLKKGFRYLK